MVINGLITWIRMGHSHYSYNQFQFYLDLTILWPRSITIRYRYCWNEILRWQQNKNVKILYEFANYLSSYKSLCVRVYMYTLYAHNFVTFCIQTQIKESIKVPRHWPLCGEFNRGRWIPRTNGQLRGKCFHLVTSSCNVISQGLEPVEVYVKTLISLTFREQFGSAA